jgi:hypothetical protein
LNLTNVGMRAATSTLRQIAVATNQAEMRFSPDNPCS